MTTLPIQQLPRYLLVILLMSSSAAFAQNNNDELDEVDRILAEINGGEQEAVPDAEPGDTPEDDPVAVVEDEEMIPLEEEADVADVPAMPATDTIPAIRLEEARGVPGMEMTQAAPDDDLISITLDNVRLADVVRIFARSSGANIIIPEGLDELVSANLNDVNWREALEVILADKEYVLIQRRPGIFAISRLDQLASEPLSTETIDLKFVTVENALPAVEGMIVTSNARVTPLPAANVLIVRETPRQLEEIRNIIALIDVPRQQVFIEAKFVELNDSARQDLGIDWQVLGETGVTLGIREMVRESERTDRRSRLDGQGNVTGSGSASTVTSGTGLDPTRVSQRDSANFTGSVQGRNISAIDGGAGTITGLQTMESEVIRGAIMTASDFAVTLRALQSLNGVSIVSNPKMLVANGQTARIHVGRNEPNIRALPSGDQGTNFIFELDGFIETGVKLEVTPSVSTARNISLNIIPELSRILERREFQGGTVFPVTASRRIETEFALESGNTVAIGGLTEGFDSEVTRKVPLLGDLPLIGKYLFRYTRTERQQEEIIIFVSVQIAEAGSLDNRSGLPEQGTLINTWLEHDQARRTARQQAIDQAAAEAANRR
jgi:type IV pilus assembly protein PilQ